MKKKTKVPPNWEERPDAFQRFERLAKGLMAVPKKELDKQNKQTAKQERLKKGKSKRA